MAPSSKQAFRVGYDVIDTCFGAVSAMTLVLMVLSQPTRSE